jgi:CheY-like chemotaxis protein
MILLVEDNQDLRRAARLALEQAGFSVLEAADGLEALELQSRQPIDILITDLRLPNLDGDALARRLWLRQPSLPVLIMTSHVEDPSARLGGRAVLWLSKPFPLDALIEAARQLQENALVASSVGSIAKAAILNTTESDARVLEPTATGERRGQSLFWAMAAALVLVCAGLALYDRRAPSLPERLEVKVERGGKVEGLAPQGPLATPPESLTWNPLAGALAYSVTVQGVDRRIVFDRETPEPFLKLPPELGKQLRPNAAYYWRVEARDDQNRALASADAHFRIVKTATTSTTEALP